MEHKIEDINSSKNDTLINNIVEEMKSSKDSAMMSDMWLSKKDSESEIEKNKKQEINPFDKYGPRSVIQEENYSSKALSRAESNDLEGSVNM